MPTTATNDWYDIKAKQGRIFNDAEMCPKIYGSNTLIGCPSSAQPVDRPIVGMDNKYYYTACDALCGKGANKRCYKQKIERTY